MELIDIGDSGDGTFSRECVLQEASLVTDWLILDPRDNSDTTCLYTLYNNHQKLCAANLDLFPKLYTDTVSRVLW